MSAEMDALQAKLEAAEMALQTARERQGKRLEWIWDGLRAICAMDPNTEAERMQQWASDTLYGAATPEEWEPDVRAMRMEEFKNRPPLAGHAGATTSDQGSLLLSILAKKEHPWMCYRCGWIGNDAELATADDNHAECPGCRSRELCDDVPTIARTALVHATTTTLPPASLPTTILGG